MTSQLRMVTEQDDGRQEHLLTVDRTTLQLLYGYPVLSSHRQEQMLVIIMQVIQARDRETEKREESKCACMNLGRQADRPAGRLENSRT